jgi:hypothetical protein
MQSHRRPLAFLSGFTVYVGGLAAAMAATSTPLNWVFAGHGGWLPLTVRLLILALPSLLLAAAWTYFSLRSRQRSRRSTWLWYRIGMALAMVFTFTAGFFALAQLDETKVWSPLSLLTSARMPPFWGLQNSLAILLGAWLGHRWLPARTDLRRHGSQAARRLPTAPESQALGQD